MKTKTKPKPAPSNGRSSDGRFRRGQAPKPSAKPPLVVERVNLHTLHEDPSNANKHPEEDIVGLMAKLATFTQVEPLVIQKSTRKVIGGNGRLEAMRRLGWVQCDVHFVDVDNVTATALGISLNRRKSIFDESALVAQLQAIQSENADLMAAVGYAQTEIDALIAGLKADITPPPDPGAQVDRAEELLAKWKVEAGQLWVIPSKATPGGDHRVLCGDSTRAEDVARVIGDEKADFCVTSPPYWVGKDYEQEHTWEEVQAFIEAIACRMSEAVDRRIVINTGAPQAAHLTGERAHVRLLLDDWQVRLSAHGWLMRYVRIWSKRGGLTHTSPQSDCIDQHWEFIATFYRPNRYEGQRRCGEKWATDGIWDDIPGDMSSNGHVAAFPLDIPLRNITLYTDRGAIILDPFLGSGTTIVAAEQTGRLARGIELAPKYVAVTLERLSGLGLIPHLQAGA